MLVPNTNTVEHAVGIGDDESASKTRDSTIALQSSFFFFFPYYTYLREKEEEESSSSSSEGVRTTTPAALVPPDAPTFQTGVVLATPHPTMQSSCRPARTP